MQAPDETFQPPSHLSHQSELWKGCPGLCEIEGCQPAGEGDPAGWPSVAASQRDAHRRWVADSVEPLAGLVADVLSEALADDVQLDLSHLLRPDSMSAARALRSLVDSGMALAEARQIVGI